MRMDGGESRTMDATTEGKLVQRALEARDAAYAPYSGFRVGAALLSADGRVFTGCNVENASFGATICAERTAVAKAVSEGARTFTAVAIASYGIEPCVPCGICRQTLFEFAADGFTYLSVAADGTYVRYGMDEILPHGFRALEGRK
jgi:cytidine deaminase